LITHLSKTKLNHAKQVTQVWLTAVPILSRGILELRPTDKKRESELNKYYGPPAKEKESNLQKKSYFNYPTILTINPTKLLQTRVKVIP